MSGGNAGVAQAFAARELGVRGHGAPPADLAYAAQRAAGPVSLLARDLP